MEILDKLRKFNLDSLSLDEAMFLLVNARQLAAGYGSFQASVPEWLNDNIVALEREVRSRYRDELERRLKEVKARRANFRSAEEKRQDADAEIAALEKALGTQQP